MPADEADAAPMSAVERRRLARQRKILENADSRMGRLCGRPAADGAEAAPTEAAVARHNHTAEACPDPPDQPIQEVLRLSAQLGQPAATNGSMEDLLRQLGGQGTAQQADGSQASDPPLGVWWRRWDQFGWLAVALLAVLTRLSLLAGLGVYLGENVLVPFFVLETTMYLARLWAVPLRPSSGLLGTALMLCGLPPRTMELWSRYISFLSRAWSDFMVYAFALVLSFRLISPAALVSIAGSEAGPEMAPAAYQPELPADHVEF